MSNYDGNDDGEDNDGGDKDNDGSTFCADEVNKLAA